MSNFSLFQELEQLLRPHSAYCTEDGVLLKNSIVEAALQLRPDLLKLILSNERLKANFFTDVEGMLVFDKVRFQKFVMNKRFLPDSYTSFKNKIGLTTDEGDFLAESREVVLSWPYKDCVLEGGQTKEDAKRNEVFWNEILAPDEINRLTEPKVLTNFKKFDADGEHNVESISKADNLIIKGNNLLALHSLKKTYAGQVKLIYIDPPYNTGNDGFQYNDSFNHSTWLTFMRNRLTVARELLRNDGVIFVQCDYHEDAYLKVLLDEIFGLECFVQNISVKMSEASGPKMAHAKRNIPKLKETLLIYKKNQFDLVEVPKVLKSTWDKEYAKILLNITNEDADILLDLLSMDSVADFHVKQANEILSKVCLSTISDFDSTKKNDNQWLSMNSWRIVADKQNTALDSLLSNQSSHPKQDIAVIKTKRNKLVAYRTDKNFGEDSRVEIVFAINNLASNPCDFWTDISTAGGFSEEGGVSFPGGKKPETLLERIIKMSSRENDIVLDYHLGSGTTAAVAHKMGRSFIGIEQMDYGENDSVVRLQNVVGKKVKDGLFDKIECDQTGISKTINWQGGGSFVYCELAKANQDFADQILASENKEELALIWQQMQEIGFLSWKIDPRQINENAEDFASLSIADKQKFLLEALDKNLLYIPYSEIDNQEFGISLEAKRLNAQFYGKA
ncbi:MAG: site-specific DNA-methyltransferase [Prolixibacteraceae bacterium]|nr:site-specific DNA-methyltransferase [Prolixibacteraceae bacterium]